MRQPSQSNKTVKDEEGGLKKSKAKASQKRDGQQQTTIDKPKVKRRPKVEQCFSKHIKHETIVV